MHVVIVGCGRVGSGLARIIEEKGHSVAIVDKDPRAFRRLHSGFSGKQVVGVGFDRERLEEAGIHDADAVAAVTSGDNSNILTARVARETFGIERVVARIYDPRRAIIYERLGIPTIATVQWTIDRVVRRLIPEAEESDWIDPSARVVLVEREVSASWAGRPLSEIEIPGVARAVAVFRMGAAQIATPDLVTQDGDLVYLAVAIGHVSEVDEHLSGAESSGSVHK
jgi:trk/ktr system potassium uptake protein